MSAAAVAVSPRKHPSPPWISKGNHEHWVSVGRFALVVNRTRFTVHKWLRNGTLTAFGYRAYRDVTGKWFIEITDKDLEFLKRVAR